MFTVALTRERLISSGMIIIIPLPFETFGHVPEWLIKFFAKQPVSEIGRAHV